jgi:hypothetical protein
LWRINVVRDRAVIYGGEVIVAFLHDRCRCRLARVVEVSTPERKGLKERYKQIVKNKEPLL